MIYDGNKVREVQKCIKGSYLPAITTHTPAIASTATMIPIIAPNGNVSGSVMIVGVVVDGAGIAEAVCKW